MTQLDTPVFTMSVETIDGVKPHGFHLGTDKAIAESFVFERLKAGAMSVALYFGGKAVKIYDYRDLEREAN